LSPRRMRGRQSVGAPLVVKRGIQTKSAWILVLGFGWLTAILGCRQTPNNYAVSTAISPNATACASGTVGAAPPNLLLEPSSSGSNLSLSGPPLASEAIILAQHKAKPSGDDQQMPLRLPEDIAAFPAQTDQDSSETSQELVTAGALSETGQPIEYFVGIAMANHPRVRAARARVAAASQRAPQARSLDDPTLTNSFYPISDQALQTAAGRAGNTLSVAQKYPWPEKRWTKAAIANRETQMAVAKLVQVELEIEETIHLAYYELWFATRAIGITEQNRQIAVELVKLAETRYGAGGRQQDVLRAELQLDALDDRLVGLRRQKAIAQADLAALIQQTGRIGIEPTADISVDQVPKQLEALFAAAQECSPRIRERQWAVSRDRQKQQLACLNKYPDFILGAGWQSITESDAVSRNANGHDNVNVMVGVTLPIWRDKINASIREASAEVTASCRELNDAQDDTFRQIRRFSEQAYAADEQLRLYNQRILPRAKRALKLAAADYRGKLVDFGEVADGFTEVLMFELQVARTKATLAGAVAQIRRAVGCEIAVDL
jgi:cobalt-zinc-cadmium efflux system outer membrane protein